MKIAIIGYGKMGKEIEAIALERGHEIIAKLTSKDKDFSSDVIKEADACIEFTRPESAVENLKKCFEAGVPVVTGTTGWYDQFENIKNECQKFKGGLFYATNFSIGVNLFFAINRYMGQLFNNYPEYKVSMEEIHHTQKLDAPSGTAITTAENILDNYSLKDGWTLLPEQKDSAIPIEAKRIENVPGTHTVTFESDIDKVEISHEAKSRKGFALGSVLAAEFMKEKSGIYTMKDLLGIGG